MLLASAKVNMGWGACFLRAVGCNWLVCLSLYCAISADDVFGRLAGIWPPITAFVAIGFEHSVANMFFIPLGLFQGAPDTDGGKLFYNNLIPVTLGNMVGGFLFAGCAFYFMYLHSNALHVATVKAMSKTTNVHRSIQTKPVSHAPTVTSIADVPIMPISLDTLDQQMQVQIEKSDPQV